MFLDLYNELRKYLIEGSTLPGLGNESKEIKSFPAMNKNQKE